MMTLNVQGSGVAIYFPNAGNKFQATYTSLVNFDPESMSGWMSFLTALYKATADYAKLATGIAAQLIVTATY